jgi:pSer/pThr/pTyr-binding forkhead associated (FHA) protein
MPVPTTTPVTFGVVRGLAGGSRFVLPLGSHVVGRADDADVHVLDESVSAAHCRVEVRS